MLSVAAPAAVAVPLLLAGTARGEEKHGVPVYPGARYDAATTGALRDAMNLDAACYRTDDDVAKVTAFYAKQPGFKVLAQGAEGSMIKKGDVDVTVQRPWMGMKSGAMNKDTLVSIVKQRQAGPASAGEGSAPGPAGGPGAAWVRPGGATRRERRRSGRTWPGSPRSPSRSRCW
jgi:hypothetical protein